MDRLSNTIWPEAISLGTLGALFQSVYPADTASEIASCCTIFHISASGITANEPDLTTPTPIPVAENNCEPNSNVYK